MTKLSSMMVMMLALAGAACDMADPIDGDPGAGGTGAGIDDEGGGGALPMGPWDCLGQVEPPVFEPGSSAVSLTIASFPGAAPLADVSVEVCLVDDVDCDAPLSSGVSDADGRVTVEVPTDVVTYYQVTGEAVVPSLFFRRGLPPAAGSDEVELGALTPATLEAFMTVVDVQSDPARGHLVMTARDCHADLGVGVSFDVSTSDADSTLAYLAGALPSTTATETDANGRAGVLNLPPGDATVTSYLVATDERIGERELFIRPGWLSLVGVVPSP